MITESAGSGILAGLEFPGMPEDKRIGTAGEHLPNIEVFALTTRPDAIRFLMKAAWTPEC
ncbi:hypothetical protein [Streptosporangium sp. NPDC048865]|uniref:hypothetical protein n=1 Tax=Streptosporangium sp. NPDC048865 TaxID=3155766 RepID=UPI00342F7035